MAHHAMLVCAMLAAVCMASPPAGFATRQMKTGFNDNNAFIPSKTRFLPNGQIMYSIRSGSFYVASVPAASSTAGITPSLLFTLNNVDSDGEIGLNSFVLDPNFSSNGYFYAYYSSYTNNAFRISRFTYTAANIAASEVVLYVDPDGLAGQVYHFGGDIEFGPDGRLYVSTGEKSRTSSAAAAGNMLTCVIRINTDGSVPANNNDGYKGAACWLRGVRNGYRSHWDLPSNRYFVANVGGNDQNTAVEEVYLGFNNANLGWPKCEGACGNPDFGSNCNCAANGLTGPLYWYNHKDSNQPTYYNAAIIGGFVYRGSMFPSNYYGAYFFGDFARKTIRYLSFDASNNLLNTYSNVYSNVGAGNFDMALPDNIIDLALGPDGSLWFSTWSAIYRVVYTSATVPTTTTLTTTTTRTTTVKTTPIPCSGRAKAVTINWYAGPIGTKFDRTVCLGDVVKWVWKDNQPHTVSPGTPSSPGGPKAKPSSLNITIAPYTYKWKPGKVGKYPFFCFIHSTNMMGTLTVLPHVKTTTTTTTTSTTTTKVGEPGLCTTGQTSIMGCMDGSTCNVATQGWGCCTSGRKLCPGDKPYMCTSQCSGSNCCDFATSKCGGAVVAACP